MKSFICLVVIFCFSLTSFGWTINCNGFICGDVIRDNVVNALDHSGISGAFGNDMTIDTSCAEGVYTENGYMDIQDILAWFWRMADTQRLTICFSELFESFMQNPSGGNAQSTSGLAGPGYGSSLLLSGNIRDANGIFSMNEDLVIYDSQGNYVANPFTMAAPKCNGRVFCDGAGKIFQLNTSIGVVRLNDGAAVITPGRFSIAEDPRYEDEAIVSIGIQTNTTATGTDFAGRPIMDAAVDSQGYMYVVPVVVTPSADPSLTYLAAAKLQLQPGQSPCYSIVRLYDDPPQPNDYHDPLRYGLSEIEVDNSGNVYITNAHYNYIDDDKSNFLWVYPADNTAPTKIDLDTLSGVTGGIPDPTGLFASKKNQMLYLTSGLNPPEATSVKVYGLSTQNLSLTLSRTVQVNDMGHVTGITENPVSGSLWVAGFKMVNIPDIPDISVAPFYHAGLVQIPTTSNDPVQATCLDTSSSLALPFSVTWMPSNLVSSNPIDQQYLWRSAKNICRLTFDGDITTPPAGSILIQEMQDGGQYGQNLSSNFTFTVENNSSGKPRILKIYETTQCLTNRKWFAIRNTGAWTGVSKFIVQYPFQKGDSNNDGAVSQSDVDYVITGIPNFNCADDDRRDVDGDKKILVYDYSTISTYYPATPVAKPSGH